MNHNKPQNEQEQQGTEESHWQQTSETTLVQQTTPTQQLHHSRHTHPVNHTRSHTNTDNWETERWHTDDHEPQTHSDERSTHLDINHSTGEITLTLAGRDHAQETRQTDPEMTRRERRAIAALIWRKYIR